jgi:hypothetical protein
MATVRDAIAYICSHYPSGGDLSETRLTKIVYLADWRSAITRKRTLTDISWMVNGHGPYVDDVIEAARHDADFVVEKSEDSFGSPKEVIRVKPDVLFPSITADDKRVLDFVISTVSKLTWREFIELVYSTYPIVNQQQYQKLDFVKLAEEYAVKRGTPAGAA